ncbi:uncharacterized protein LOC133192891 [Saccostrea echinata]|uniref:uncharacterized protein LOC133192891 n=1 Tax=Saccostrea echinata TaxID=191078 RepID=UPI002A82E66B|nr:uncharacterized protein LOC133192891 [Saccostrea echinata]
MCFGAFQNRLPTICEERIYEDREEIHQKYFELSDDGNSAPLSDTTKFTSNGENEWNTNNFSFPTIYEDGNCEAESGAQINFESDNGNKFTTGHSSDELNTQLSSFVRAELDVIAEEKVYDDPVIQQRYFLSDEAGIPRKSTPDAVKKIQNDTLLRHWINLCNENNQDKRSLEKELLGYRDGNGVSWDKFAEQKLLALQKEYVKLENMYEQMKFDLSSSVPEISLSVGELTQRIREIYGEQMRCYSPSEIAEGKIPREENMFRQGNLGPVDLPTVNQQKLVCIGSKKKTHDECEKSKPSEKNRAYACRKEQSKNLKKLRQKNERSEKILRKPEINDRTFEKTQKESQSGILSLDKDFASSDGCSQLQIQRSNGSSGLPPNFSHSVNGLQNGVKLPQIQPCLHMKGEVNCSSQQSKSVCKLPEIQSAKKQTRLEPCSSASDPNQTPSKLPAIQGQAMHEKKAATRTPSSPKILPPLLNIPKSSKEIRKCFQVPKQKRPQMSIGKTNSYDILIIEHSESNTSANCVPKIMSKGHLNSDRNKGKGKMLAPVVETAKGTEDDFLENVQKKQKKNRISSGRRHDRQ